MLDKMIETLSKDLELDPPLREESSGVFLIPVGGGRSIEAREMEVGYLLKGGVCSLPKEGGEERLVRLMSLSLFGKGTYGASFALNEKGKELFALYRDAYSADYMDFKEHLEDLINCCDFWRKEIQVDLDNQS
jgi:hypothetical protein